MVKKERREERIDVCEKREREGVALVDRIKKGLRECVWK